MFDIREMLSSKYALSNQWTTFCKECRGNLVFDPHTNELICCSCGRVSESREIGESFFAGLSSHGMENESALGMTYDFELPTIIGDERFDAHGRGVQESFELSRLRKLNNFTISKDSKWRNLTKGMDEIRRITEMLNLGYATAERAYQIY